MLDDVVVGAGAAEVMGVGHFLILFGWRVGQPEGACGRGMLGAGNGSGSSGGSHHGNLCGPRCGFELGWAWRPGGTLRCGDYTSVGWVPVAGGRRQFGLGNCGFRRRWIPACAGMTE